MWGAPDLDVADLGAEWGAKTCESHSETAPTAGPTPHGRQPLPADDPICQFMSIGRPGGHLVQATSLGCPWDAVAACKSASIWCPMSKSGAPNVVHVLESVYLRTNIPAARHVSDISVMI
jgi:hypothetical protein